MGIFRKWRIKRLRDARERAQAKYDGAVKRRDTRAMSVALHRLADATHALMKAEAVR